MRWTQEQYEKHMGFDNVEPVKLCRGAGERAERPTSLRSDARAAAPLYPVLELCAAAGLPEPVPEYVFARPRKWRFDYCWPLQRLALEIEGGLWVNGRHSRGSGAIADLEKYSEAAILGWRVLYATPEEVRSGVAIDRVRRALRPLEFAA